MGKLVAWLVVIFVVLLALRVVNARKRRVNQSGGGAGAGPAGGIPKIEPMVRCERCGIYLPRNEALVVAGAHTCADKNCSTRQAR